jgi:Glycosidases
MKKIYLVLLTTMLLAIGTVNSMAKSFIGDRTDFRDETIYFMITTRFYDGDKTNNTQCWDNQSANTGDPAWRGDFKGIIEKLDYIKALGFTTIWITPVVENASGYDYHGYHALNFSKVDKRYESGDVSFQTLIDAVHAKGMKLILDIVLNHTGNFGEENLCKEFTRNWNADQADLTKCMIPNTDVLGSDYNSLKSGDQYARRLAMMKNTDNINHDIKNYWHHFGNFNWDNETRWYAQIAGDCVDLNTENPRTYKYVRECYASFIKMGVDGFRIDTSGHIARVTFNNAFIPYFEQVANSSEAIAKRGNTPFYMFGEVCARFGGVVYRDQTAMSPFFYTWAGKNYGWTEDETEWDTEVKTSEGLDFSQTNLKACEKEYADYSGQPGSEFSSTNAFLSGNSYHAPNYAHASGFNVIDFPMHYNFTNAGSAVNIAKSGDQLYNDATWNVVYVDSHDYSPQPNDGIRFNGGTSLWAENLSMMFTFRGIPCIYYGSEIEFRAGKKIDNGPNGSLSDTGRAYYGGYITGDVNASDFGEYTASGNVAATLDKDLAQHLVRLNKIRAAVPALRKGQYSWDRCNSNGGYAFKRRYTDSSTDSYALIALNAGATFSGVLNGTYTDVVTGNKVTVGNGILTTDNFSGQGNMRIYVLNGPGKIGEDGKFIYSSSSVSREGRDIYDGLQEAKVDEVVPVVSDTLNVYAPSVATKEVSVFYEANKDVKNVTVWAWNDKENFTGSKWPGQNMTVMGYNKDKTKIIFKWTYSGVYTDNPTKIIFSDAGQNQTVDLVYNNNGYYVNGVFSKTIGTTDSTMIKKDTVIGKPDSIIIIKKNETCEGWPAQYSGVMLQSFYWDGYNATSWNTLTSRATELSKNFDIIWVPNSGYCNSTTNQMGYMPSYYFNETSSFGNEAELRNMIKTYKNNGTGIIEDVVINHKNGVLNWCDFATETWNGNTLKWSLADICCTDEAKSAGYNVSGAVDTGDDFNGCRDLDHTSANVQKNIKTYLDYLLYDLGYTGFRYDMVKGYGAQYTKMYNESARPKYSVGEYWDGSYNNVANWIKSTGYMSAAFDFPLKYIINDAFGNDNWGALASKGLAGDPNINRYAVTFVDNHDTSRDNNKLSNNILAANAFILAMPGTPCIWLPHYDANKTEMDKMIKARHDAGLTNQSQIISSGAQGGGYVMKVKGTKADVMIISGYVSGADTNGFKLVSSGQNYAYYISDTTHVVTSGLKIYVEASSAPNLYVWNDSQQPLNGSWPGTKMTTTTTLSGTTWYVASFDASAINIILNNGSSQTKDITGITKDTFFSYDGNSTYSVVDTATIVHTDGIYAYFEAPSNWSNVNVWAWSGSVNYYSSWPGKAIYKVATATNGNAVYKWTYDGTITKTPEYVIFNNGSQQTANLLFTNGGYYTYNGYQYQTAKLAITGINYLTPVSTNSLVKVYSINGQLLKTGYLDSVMKTLDKGFYIVNGKKIMIE